MTADHDVPRWGRRHTVLALCVLGLVLAYTDRVNMAVASVAMKEEFGWSQTTKGLVLASFFIGYLLFMVASGVLANRYGGKRVLGAAVAWWSACTLLTPIAAAWSLPALIAARIALGLGEAAVLPATYELFSRWVPATERGRAMGWFLSGIPLGQVIGLTASGWLVERAGWPSSFYVFGALGLVWAAYWMPRISGTPANDAALGAAERALLAEGTPAQAGGRPPTPWGRLLRHPAVWAIVVAHFAANWCLYILLSWLPSYFREAQGLSLASSGLYSAAPWVASFIGMLSAGVASDAAIRRGVRVLTVRRVLTSLGLAGPAVFLLLVQTTHSAPAALALICAATALEGMCVGGFSAGPLDIAPRHAAVLIALSNTVATLPGVAGVAITGWLVDRTHTYAAAFLLTATVGFLGAAFYLRFASAEPIER